MTEHRLPGAHGIGNLQYSKNHWKDRMEYLPNGLERLPAHAEHMPNTFARLLNGLENEPNSLEGELSGLENERCSLENERNSNSSLLNGVSGLWRHLELHR